MIRPGSRRSVLTRAVADGAIRIGPLLVVGVIGWLGETGKDGGFIRDIWQALKTASPPVAMIMFFLYMRESQKRDEAQKQCNDRTIDFVKATNLATNTFSRALALISNPRRTVRRTR